MKRCFVLFILEPCCTLGSALVNKHDDNSASDWKWKCDVSKSSAFTPDFCMYVGVLSPYIKLPLCEWTVAAFSFNCFFSSMKLGGHFIERRDFLLYISQQFPKRYSKVNARCASLTFLIPHIIKEGGKLFFKAFMVRASSFQTKISSVFHVIGFICSSISQQSFWTSARELCLAQMLQHTL